MSASRLAAAASLALALAACTPAAAPLPPPPPAPAAAPVPDRCDDVASCEASCKQGPAARRTERCAEAAKRMRRSPTETDLARFMDVLQRACDGGHGESCNGLAMVLQSAPSLAPDDARDRALQARACELGEAVGCLEAAKRTGTPNRTPSASAAPPAPEAMASGASPHP